MVVAAVVETLVWAVVEEDPQVGEVVVVAEEAPSLLVVLVAEVVLAVVVWAEAGLVIPTSKTRPSTPYQQTSVALSLVKVGSQVPC